MDYFELKQRKVDLNVKFDRASRLLRRIYFFEKERIEEEQRNKEHQERYKDFTPPTKEDFE